MEVAKRSWYRAQWWSSGHGSHGRPGVEMPSHARMKTPTWLRSLLGVPLRNRRFSVSTIALPDVGGGGGGGEAAGGGGRGGGGEAEGGSGGGE